MNKCVFNTIFASNTLFIHIYTHTEIGRVYKYLSGMKISSLVFIKPGMTGMHRAELDTISPIQPSF